MLDDRIGPYRDHPEREKMNEGRDQMKYADYLHGQVKELLTEYGDIDIMWFDFSYPDAESPEDFAQGKGRAAWRSEELYKIVRSLQPDIIMNDRLDLDDGWDVKTPEQYQPRRRVTVEGRPVVWEACQTFSGSWGYHRDEESWKSVEQLIRMLVDTVSKGGNLLLNVGPTARGELDARALESLEGMGEWMKRHDRSIYACAQAPDRFKTPSDCRLTYNPDKNRLYVHAFAWPFKHLHLEGKAFCDEVKYAQLLNDGSEVLMEKFSDKSSHHGGDAVGGNALTLTLPVKKPPVTVPVIELFL